jgi:hypothetical protein
MKEQVLLALSQTPDGGIVELLLSKYRVSTMEEGYTK